tara:strand:+ start:1003 stop:1293 length:291 start_codon:yes stop_codon:yes gene_type:complete
MAKKTTKKEIKFTQEELTSLENLKQGYDSIEKALGSLEISRMQTEQTLEKIVNEKVRVETNYDELKKSEAQLLSTLNEKYGRGNLDPTTGVFTPAK